MVKTTSMSRTAKNRIQRALGGWILGNQISINETEFMQKICNLKRIAWQSRCGNGEASNLMKLKDHRTRDLEKQRHNEAEKTANRSA